MVRLKNHDDAVTSLAWEAGSRLLASGSADKSVVVWDLREYQAAGDSSERLVGRNDPSIVEQLSSVTTEIAKDISNFFTAGKDRGSAGRGPRVFLTLTP